MQPTQTDHIDKCINEMRVLLRGLQKAALGLQLAPLETASVWTVTNEYDRCLTRNL